MKKKIKIIKIILLSAMMLSICFSIFGIYFSSQVILSIIRDFNNLAQLNPSLQEEFNDYFAPGEAFRFYPSTLAPFGVMLIVSYSNVYSWFLCTLSFIMNIVFSLIASVIIFNKNYKKLFCVCSYTYADYTTAKAARKEAKRKKKVEKLRRQLDNIEK